MKSLEGVPAMGLAPNVSRGSMRLVTKLVARLSSTNRKIPFTLVMQTDAGPSVLLEGKEPLFSIYIRNQAGLNALKSLNELKITEAYIRNDIDIEGDFLEAMSLRDMLSDRNIWIKTWRRIKPMLLGRERCNPDWIGKHYDSKNIQLFAADADYNTYTPGIYEDEGDSLEVGAERKLDFAFRSLNLKSNDSVLDIGCGWGGFLRFAARRGARVTGITLSKDQRQYVERLIQENNFNAEVKYQDFFSFQPSEKYDGIVMMGVLEDLADYRRVMKHISEYLKPGGRVYLDFASSKGSFDTCSFITKYVWPGTFRMVYMPQLIDAVRESPFEIVSIYNDRRNYYFWCKGGHDRWVHKKAEIINRSSSQQWRMLRLLFGGSASIMNSPSYNVTAYRMILELPKDLVTQTNSNPRSVTTA